MRVRTAFEHSCGSTIALMRLLARPSTRGHSACEGGNACCYLAQVAVNALSLTLVVMPCRAAVSGATADPTAPCSSCQPAARAMSPGRRCTRAGCLKPASATARQRRTSRYVVAAMRKRYVHRLGLAGQP